MSTKRKLGSSLQPVTRTIEEVERQLNLAAEWADSAEDIGKGNYEDGVKDALGWITGDTNVPPIAASPDEDGDEENDDDDDDDDDEEGDEETDEEEEEDEENGEDEAEDES